MTPLIGIAALACFVAFIMHMLRRSERELKRSYVERLRDYDHSGGSW